MLSPSLDCTTKPKFVSLSICPPPPVIFPGVFRTRIVTCWTVVAELPEWSVAFHSTTVVPTGKPLDVALLVIRGEGSATSLTVGVPSLTLVNAPLAGATMSGGGMIVGGVVSRTVTLRVADPTFPAASSAEQVIIVSPNGKTVPDAGTHLGPLVTPTKSEAVAFG